MSIEHLIKIHTDKREKARHYSRNLTLFMATLCFVFFGTILCYQAMAVNSQRVTGMAVATRDYVFSGGVGETASDITGFVTAVRSSLQVTEIKLFFYTAWILVVLIGTAISYEFREKI